MRRLMAACGVPAEEWCKATLVQDFESNLMKLVIEIPVPAGAIAAASKA